MIDFLDKYASLANKNNPIIVSYGDKLCNNIFKKQINKKQLDGIINNIKNIDNLKYKINYITDIQEFKTSNINLVKYNNQIDYLIIDIHDKCLYNNLYLIKYTIQQDAFLVPSISQFESIEKYEEMNIVVNNWFDIKVKDYRKYYTLDVIIKKPNNSKLLANLLEKIFN